MALHTKHGLSIFMHALCVAAFSFMVLGSDTKQESQGFNLKLIPIHSTESPFYIANLTQEQRFKKLAEISHARYLHLESRRIIKTTNASIAIAQPPLYLQDATLMVQVHIGRPPKQFYLVLDTGSEITWVQSADCTHCFKIKDGSFDRWKSSSFKYLPCGHPRCRGGIEGCDGGSECTYRVAYGYNGTSYTEGDIGLDYFSFLSDKPNVLTEVKMLFGVGKVNFIGFGPDTANNIAGIFGLSRGDYSFLYQYQLYYGSLSLGRFSYCLFPWISPSSTLLKFGRNAYIPPHLHAQTTPFVKGPMEELYFLKCTGLSVAGHKLQFTPDAFRGGLIIDTGTPISRFPKDAYDAVLFSLFLEFRGKNLEKWTGADHISDYCFLRPQGFNQFPNMTVHLLGADWHVKPEGLFAIGTSFFCLSILPVANGQLGVLGGILQTNTLFVHDLASNKLSFAPEQCI